MENISKLEVQPATNGINLIENTKEMRNFFHQYDKEITWIIISTIIATFLREGFR